MSNSSNQIYVEYAFAGKHFRGAVTTYPMNPDFKGITALNRYPFLIILNGAIPRGRVYVSLIHELVHVGSALYRIHITEDQVHILALETTSSIVPLSEKYHIDLESMRKILKDICRRHSINMNDYQNGMFSDFILREILPQSHAFKNYYFRSSHETY